MAPQFLADVRQRRGEAGLGEESKLQLGQVEAERFMQHARAEDTPRRPWRHESGALERGLSSCRSHTAWGGPATGWWTHQPPFTCFSGEELSGAARTLWGHLLPLSTKPGPQCGGLGGCHPGLPPRLRLQVALSSGWALPPVQAIQETGPQAQTLADSVGTRG